MQGFCDLFPLDGSGWLRSQIIQHSVDAGNFVGDAVYDLAEEGVGDLLDGGGHGVLRVDGADDAGPLEAAEAILYAN